MILTKQGEIDATVGTMLHEMGMGGEIVVFAMLKNEDTFGLQQVTLEDEVGNGGQLFERVGRIGKDKAERLLTGS